MYRRGHHSTSDDSTAYRSKDEIEQWLNKNPITRLRLYLKNKNIWNEQNDDEFAKETKKEVNFI